MTQTARDSAPTAAVTEPVPRRPLTSRLEFGHVVMVLSGLLAFLLVLASLRQGSEVVQVAVAAHDIPAGSTLDMDDVRLVPASASDGSLLGVMVSAADAEALVERGAVTSRSVREGDPLLAGDLADASDSTGQRSMSIELTAGQSVGGRIEVGDVIDVIVVRRGVAEYVTTASQVVDVVSASGSIAASTRIIVTITVDGPTSLRLASAIADGGIFAVRSTGAAPTDPQAVFDPGGDDA